LSDFLYRTQVRVKHEVADESYEALPLQYSGAKLTPTSIPGTTTGYLF
jgi:hypothetical protein